MTKIVQAAIGLLVASAAIPAMAVPVPEPESLSLFAVAVGGIVVVRALRNRRK